MWFELSYTFLGGLGLFFFGMKTMSESLQAIASNFIRNIIKALTTNRFMAVLVGIFVTTIIQSSSVTTVMVVGFVNAGLMELTQAIGVIFGANIGTTITGWIIAIKVGKYGLLFVAIGVFPLLFSKQHKVKHVGRLLVSLGFIFMGLEFMSSSFKPLRNMDSFLNLLQYFSADSFLTLIACIGIGACLTFVVQSSSAMLGVTIALAASGAISFQTAAALVLGENIGTTITALLASIGANTDAKRAARAHALFNVIGVCFIMVPIFWKYLEVVDGLIIGAPDFIDASGTKPNIAAHIAAAHSLFNIVNTIIFLPLIKPLAALVTFITPAPKQKEVPHLQSLNINVDQAPGLALSAAEKSLQKISKVVFKQLGCTKEYLLSEDTNPELRKRISKYETISDNIQTEITVFLCQVQAARLSPKDSAFAYAMIRAADEFESVGDYCDNLARYRDRLTQSKEKISSGAIKELEDLFDKIIKFYRKIDISLQTGNDWDLRDLNLDMEEVICFANTMQENHRDRLNQGMCKPIAGMLFSDMVVGIRKIKNHLINVAEVMSGKYESGN